MTLQILDESGRPLKKSPAVLIDREGNELELETEIPMTTKDLGQERARIMIDIANKNSPSEDVHKLQLDVLYHLSLNILAHRISNVGLGMAEDSGISEWDEVRVSSFVEEVRNHLDMTVEEWKLHFFNGELVYQSKKKS